MKIQLLLAVLWLAVFECHKSHRQALTEQFYWDKLNFKFPNESIRNMALCTGSYVPEKNNIWGLGIWKDKIFVSVFRFGVGVASALNYFSMDNATKSPELIPYPSFDANYVNEAPWEKTLVLPSNSSIICGGYFRIDKCDRLWILDSGFIDYYGQRRKLAPPALVIFNLITNKLERRYTIPAEFVNSNSGFTNLDLDFTGNDCNDVFAYLVDEFRTLVVYSLKKNRSWRLVHNFFGSDPHAGNFNFEGLNVQGNFGILGISVGERHSDGSRRVYVSAFASTKSYYISNKVLQNERYIGLNKYYYDVKLLGNRGTNGQIFTTAYDKKTKVLFDTQFNRRRIGCWNTANPYRNSSFAIAYQNKMLFSVDVKVDRNRNLWVLSNSLFTFLFRSFEPNVKNIQIFKGKVDDIISGTVCSHRLPKTC